MENQTIKENLLATVREYALMFIGAMIVAVSFTNFFIPNDIAPGGVTGIATVVNHLTGWPVGVVSFAINVPLFLLGYHSGGRRFVVRSFVAMAALSLFIDLLPAEVVTSDPMLASIFGGILLGIGLGLVLRVGATTGGTDLAAQMVHNHFSFLSVGTILLAIDCAVVLLAGVVFDIQAALVALIALYISTKVMDMVLKGWNTEQQMMIISDQADEIAHHICTDMERGATMLEARGAYTGEKRGMIYCVVTRAEIMQVKTIVAQCDPRAFVTVSDAYEVMGEGFKQFAVQKREKKKK